MKKYGRIVMFVLCLSLLPVAAHLLSGCGGRGTATPFWLLPPSAPTADPHRSDRIEDGELNWSYWPDVVKTPVFGG
jgi:hypothetical protein